MKKTLIILFVSLICCIDGQVLNRTDLSKLSPETRKELIKNLNPEEKKELLRRYRDEIMMNNLNVREDQKEEFLQIYNRYQQEQRKIKDEFNGNFDPDSMSDEQAEKMLEKSFDTGQKLLDNRRKYAKEMRRVMNPQQVLKMFQNESSMREKMLNRQNGAGISRSQNGNLMESSRENPRNGMGTGTVRRSSRR